jgi:hypothetical protein
LTLPFAPRLGLSVVLSLDRSAHDADENFFGDPKAFVVNPASG